MPFSKAQIINARKTNLVYFLTSQGKTLIKEGSQYRLKGYSGLMIKDNYWYSHTLNTGGNAIDFLMKIENMSFVAAITLLLNISINTSVNTFIPENSTVKNLSIPPRNSNDKKVLAYLLNSRKLSPNLIIPLVRKGRIYESSDFHDCVFTGIDSDSTIRYIFRRSSFSYSNFKTESSGSDKRFSFSLVGNNNLCFVFEAAIDLLSYITLFEDHINKNSHFLSLGGLSDIALNYFVSIFSGIDTLILCLDNDEPGIQAAINIFNKYIPRKFYIHSHLPDFKDWNSQLSYYKK